MGHNDREGNNGMTQHPFMSGIGPAAPGGNGSFVSAVALALIAATAFAITAAAWVESDPLPLMIMAGAASLPFLLFTGAQALAWNGPYTFCLAVVIVVLQCATLRMREISDKSIDAQILMKLACLGGMCALALSGAVRISLRRRMPGIAVWLCFLVYMILTSFEAVQPQIALVETISNLATVLFLYAIAQMFGARNLVNALIAACFVLCLLSIAAYVLQPQLGRMSDWVNGAFVPTSRLTGVFGTANAAGASAGVGIMLTGLFSGVSRRRPLFYVLVLPMLLCLIVSNNRMSMFAVGTCFLYVYAMKGRIGLKFAVALLLAAIGTLVMASFGDQILEGMSRSGSASEITSGTGRTRIWSVVIDLWKDRPLFGYGAGSAKYILPIHPLLFAAAAHAHNLYLNILFAGGAVGLLLFLAGLVSTLRRTLVIRSHGLVGMLIFYLLYGMTEPAVGGLVSFVSFGFYAIIVLALCPVEDLRMLAGPHRGATPFRIAQSEVAALT